MSTYDDKIEEMLVTRRRRAEEAKVFRRQQLTRRAMYVGVGVLVLIILIVIIKAAGGKSDDNKSTTPAATETTTEAPTINTEEGDDEDESATGDEQADFTGKEVYCIDNVNLRAEADTDSEVITVVNAGETVEVEEQGEEWCKVKYDNKEGYLKLQYLSETYEEPESETSAD